MERADIYEQLTEIFQDVFDDDELTIEDSTSAEDIEAWNSLNHLSLIMEVQEQFEIEFTSGQIFNLHNVGQLVELILQLLNGTAPRSESKDFPANFIQFQSGSNDKKPLFLLHPAGGTSFAFYRPLLAHLQTEQPIYGINVPEVDNQLRHFDNIEEMATQYIEGIRTIQPESPYYLVGGSLGGIPAFEIAQQLTKQGEEVAFIAVLDCPSSKQLPTLESDFDVMSMMVNNDNKLSIDTFKKLQPDEQLNYLWENSSFFQFIFPQNNVSLLKPYMLLLLHLVKIAHNYEQKHYSGKLIYFYTVGNQLNPNIEKGWVDLASEIILEKVPGNHYTMMVEPHVRVLGQKLQKYLDDIAISQDNSQLAATLNSR